MINVLNAATPIVDQNGTMTQQMRTVMTQVSIESLIIDEGNPETNLSAVQGQRYMDSTGLTGSVLYIKQLADIGGDDKQGWVAIG